VDLLHAVLKVNFSEQVLGELLGNNWYLKVTSTLQNERHDQNLNFKDISLKWMDC